jgi:hypothetical protein
MSVLPNYKQCTGAVVPWQFNYVDLTTAVSPTFRVAH